MMLIVISITVLVTMVTGVGSSLKRKAKIMQIQMNARKTLMEEMLALFRLAELERKGRGGFLDQEEKQRRKLFQDRDFRDRKETVEELLGDLQNSIETFCEKHADHAQGMEHARKKIRKYISPFWNQDGKLADNIRHTV